MSAPAALRIDPATHLAVGVRQLLSPNFDARPAGVLPELLVVHGISLPPGEFGGPAVDQLFAGVLDCTQHAFYAELAGARLSAHALIRRDGRIVQYVPFAARAWHAGVSQYQGRSACNDFSIGIELEGADGLAYQAPQYQALCALTVALLRAYAGMSAERIVGHGDIAPGRKSDPWASFDWPRYRMQLQAALAA
jgi:N-acetyl-anhydromuramoyl-L-alanine amidase